MRDVSVEFRVVEAQIANVLTGLTRSARGAALTGGSRLVRRVKRKQRCLVISWL